MTVSITIPDEVFHELAELAQRQSVSVERIVTAAVTDQLTYWRRIEGLASRASRDRFLAALDKVPDVDPSPEDRS